MLIRKSRFSIALIWALAPLMAFAGLPRIGCICTQNGLHKFYCQRNRTVVVQERCSCCYGRQAAGNDISEDTGNCAANGMSCCGAKRVARGDGSPVVGANCPCRPVIDQSVVVATAKSLLDLDQSDRTPLVLAAIPAFVLVAAVSCDHARGDLPPPPDLVTTLGVLLI